jgi:hypothetical protein
MVRPNGLSEEIVDLIVGIVLHHFDLLEDHRPLLFNVCWVEAGVEDEICKDVHGQREVLTQNLGIVAGVLPAGEGVQDPPDGINGGRNLFGAPPLCSACLSSSFREPTGIQTPMEMDCTSGILSVRMTKPLSRTSFR